MNNTKHIQFFHRVLALPNESPAKIVIVAVAICLICSILVASAAVLLRPIQKQNEALGRQKEILKVAGLYLPGTDIATGFQAIDTRYVDLKTGEYVEKETIPRQTPQPLTDEEDIAGIGQIQPYQPVYLVHKGDKLETIILPVVGKGLWSTIHGFIALAADANTIKAITFYDHAETPGLGGEISNPSWQVKWQGKQLRDISHMSSMEHMAPHMQLQVIKGKVSPTSMHSSLQIDGLSGATLTGNGINRMLNFWMGKQAFGKLLARLQASYKDVSSMMNNEGNMTHEK